MENAVEALKIGFAVAMLVIALSLSISSFSQATEAVDAITTARDRESEYTYVKPSQNLSRTVGIDSVVTSIYRAYQENMEIHFFQEVAGTKIPLNIYNIIESDGTKSPTNIVDLSLKGLNFSNNQHANEFLDVLIGGKYVDNWTTTLSTKYANILLNGVDDKGLYEKYKTNLFEESLGEYEQGSGASKITKRVITYVKK